MPHQHGTTAYAPPVTVRAPSPASSIGTIYDDDATSDTEQKMSNLEFDRFCEEKIKLWQPRVEEELAMREPLVRDKARGAGGAAEQGAQYSLSSSALWTDLCWREQHWSTRLLRICEQRSRPWKKRKYTNEQG